MTIWLADNIADEIERLASLYYPLETGGMLLGWRDGDDRIVTGLVGPGRRALHGRYTFIPDGAWQRARLSELFASSGGDLDYLGDWHTHPDGMAEMSELDRRTLSKVERRVKAPLMVIFAGTEHDWTGGAWFGIRSSYFGRFHALAQEMKMFAPPSNWPAALSVT